jgi:hypothetical protein
VATSQPRPTTVPTTAPTISALWSELPGAGSVVLATSRRRLMTLDGAALLEVGALSAEAGTAALSAMLGDDRVAAEPTAAGRLVRLCDGLPLALRIAAARLASRPSWPTRGAGWTS